MAIEEIRKIKEIEEQADQIRKKAQSDSKAMVQEAEKEALRLVEQAKREADAASRTVLAQAAEEAGAAYDAILAAAKERCDAIVAGAEAKQAAAVEKIIGRVVR